MIKNFKHRGLKKFFETGKAAGINAQHAQRIRILLARINVAVNPKDMDAPGFYLHELKGKRKKYLEFACQQKLENHFQRGRW